MNDLVWRPLFGILYWWLHDHSNALHFHVTFNFQSSFHSVSQNHKQSYGKRRGSGILIAMRMIGGTEGYKLPQPFASW